MIEFLKDTTIKELVFLVIGGILGYLSNLIFYLKAKNNSNEKNLDRLFELSEKAIENAKNSGKLDEIKNKLDTNLSQQKISEQLDKLRKEIKKEPSEEKIVEYKLLGDEWSSEHLKNIDPQILTQDGLLFYTNILKFHNSMFPDHYIWAGKTRTTDVVINSSFNTMMPESSEATIHYNIKPIKHSEVLSNIERYCNKWNTNKDKFIKSSAEEKIDTVSKFHHEFQIIHPFIDGNGRIGRILLNDMLEFLLNKKLKKDFKKEEYYLALRMADLGDIKHMKEFVFKNLQ